MYNTEEQSLDKLIESSNLPTTVCITRKCQLQNKLVLQEGQHVTVLHIENVCVLKGSDKEGKRFIIGGHNDMYINVVKELFPKTEDEYNNVSGRINLVVIKKKFGYKSIVCDSGESLFINDHDPLFRTVTLLRDKDNEIITLPIDIFLNDEFFSYAQIKEQVKLNASVFTLEGKDIHFLSTQNKSFNLPQGIVNVHNIETISVIYTVTIPTSSKYLLYECYPVSPFIMAHKSDKLPTHVALLGGRDTDKFKEKLEEIKFVTYYDSYAPRYYGYFIEENIYYLEDWDLQIEEHKVSICSNPLHIERNIPLKHECTLKVSEPILKKLSSISSQKLAQGRSSSPSFDKTLKSFSRVKMKDGHDADDLHQLIPDEQNEVDESERVEIPEYKNQILNSNQNIETVESDDNKGNDTTKTLGTHAPNFTREPLEQDTITDDGYETIGRYQSISRDSPCVLYEGGNNPFAQHDNGYEDLSAVRVGVSPLYPLYSENTNPFRTVRRNTNPFLSDATTPSLYSMSTGEVLNGRRSSDPTIFRDTNRFPERDSGVYNVNPFEDTNYIYATTEPTHTDHRNDTNDNTNNNNGTRRELTRENPIYNLDPLDEVNSLYNTDTLNKEKCRRGMSTVERDHIYESIKIRPLKTYRPIPRFDTAEQI